MKLDLKGVFFYAVLPALIAGGFAIAPKLYDIATEPKASLSFTSTAGPVVRLSSGVKQIISTTVWNDGKRPLTDVKLIVSPEADTKIEASTFEQTTGLSFEELENENRTTYEVAGLLPGEKFSVAAMLTAQGEVKLPGVSVRSEEILGSIAETQVKQGSSNIDFAGALLASFSVFAMSIVLRRKVRGGGLPSIGGKQDVLFFIPARLKLPEIANEMRLADTNLTYLRMADILLAHGIESEDDIKDRTVKALKCMLLIEGIAESSIQIIKDNLKILEGDDFSQEEISLLREKSISVSSQSQLRKNINNYINSSAEFLTETEHA